MTKCDNCGSEIIHRPSSVRRFCNNTCRSQYQRWMVVRKTDERGYVYVRVSDHPDADSSGWILEHRVVMERHLGRRLEPDEHIHHINEIRDDNRIENLQVVSLEEHNSIHKTKAPGESHNMWFDCWVCGKACSRYEKPNRNRMFGILKPRCCSRECSRKIAHHSTREKHGCNK